jgi:ABC-type molybdate transport system substrate-binding protein
MSFNSNLPVIPSDRADDLHNLHWAQEADLVLFMAGNQFMVMPELISAFKSAYPNIRKIFFETLPPGLELKQILAQGAIFEKKVLNVYPDIYASVNEKAMETLSESGHIRSGNYHLYLHNRLTLMVPDGNPGGIVNVEDLGFDRVRISQPDPANEDIAYHIMDMYRQAGGDALVRRIMEEKKAEGTTIFTVVHHRETPIRIRKRTVDVGPVWATEAHHARSVNLPFEEIPVGSHLDQREKINYYICQIDRAANPENAEKFVSFIRSSEARSIYERYGFTAPDRQ